VTGLTAQDALTPNIIAVGEEMRPRDVAIDPLCEVFAVFKELPSSLSPLQPPFLGLVERERVGSYPLRIFADLLSSRTPYSLERSTPLAHVVSRFQHFNDNAVAVLGSPRQFLGVVTRRSLLETLLGHERRLHPGSLDTQAGATMSASEALPIQESGPKGTLPRAVQRLATEWILSEGRERQHLAGDIHDRLRQLLFVARLHLDQAQQPSVGGSATGSLKMVDQLLEESLAFTRLLIEELTPAGLRTGELLSALHMLALEMRQRGYQVDVATAPSNIKLSEPITTFLYRATRGFLRQAMGNGTSSLITVSLEGQDASIIRVKAAITGGVQSSEAEAVTLFEQTMEMSLAGIQARSKLLGIGVSVESSPGRTSALVLDISLLDSDPL
jgi:signal transduction histidine kinase